MGNKVWQELEHGNVAVVFGRESSGLTNDELDQCHYITTIPANWEFSSLNIASAVQVLCYEIYKASLTTSKHQPEDGPENSGLVNAQVTNADPLATVDQLESLFVHMQEVLEEIEFFDPKQPKLLMRRLRHLYSRSRLTSVETNILRGILSATQKVKRQTNTLK